MKKIISTTFLFGMLLSANLFSAQQLSQNQMKAVYSDDIATFKKHFSKESFNKCFPIKKDAYSPLGFSSLYGSNTLVQFLLDNKADINKKCNNKSPVELALLGKNEETAKLLIKNGAVKN